MDQKLYDLMNWPEVEEIVYSESSNPHAILGPHLREEGLLIQAFLPGAVKAEAVLKHIKNWQRLSRCCKMRPAM